MEADILAFLIVVLIALVVAEKAGLLKKWTGFMGEGKVSDVLHKLPSDYVVLDDLLLTKAAGGTAQIDHVVVSPFGLFVIETKNWHGLIVGNGKERNWRQYMGGKNYPLHNPLWQNYGHIKTLQEKFPELAPERLYSLVVFGDQVKLRLTNGAGVIRRRELLTTIRSQKVPAIDPPKAAVIAERLRQLNVQDRTQRREHVKRVKR